MSTQLDVGDIVKARAAQGAVAAETGQPARAVYFPLALVVVLAALPALQILDG